MAGGQVYRSIALPDTSTSSNSLWDSYRPYRIYPGKVSVSRSICDHCLKSGN